MANVIQPTNISVRLHLHKFRSKVKYMEPGIREFFKRLSLTIGTIVLWMMINMTIGVKLGYAFFDGSVHLGNIVFYVWVLVSFIFMIKIFIRIWKKPIEHLDD